MKLLKLIELSFFGLLFICIIFPSSNNGMISLFAITVGNVITILVLILGLYIWGRLSITRLMSTLIIILIFLFATLFSKYSNYAFGQLPSLITLLLLFFIKFDFSNNKGAVKCYYFICSYIVLVGCSSLFLDLFSDFLVNYYSGGYFGLVERLLLIFKPVSIFVSHSIAGYYYSVFILFSLFLIDKGYSKLLNISFIVSFLTMLLLLRSNTSMFFIFTSLMVMVVFMTKKRMFNLAVYFSLFFLAGILLVLFNIEIISTLISSMAGDEGNGLSSRYFDGALKYTINYIEDYPLLGIGFTHSINFVYTDSSYVLLALKLGVVGMLLFHIQGFIIFYFKDELLISVVFIAYLALFCIGYPIFSYYRFVPISILLICVIQEASVFNSKFFINSNK